MVKGADQADEAKKLVRYLTEPKEQRVFAQNNHEFGVDSLSDTTPRSSSSATSRRTRSTWRAPGKHLDDAVQMMNSVGWK